MNSKTSLTILLAACLMVISFWVSGQQKKVQNVKGEWVISNDISPAKARENALNQAKVEALRKAGVPEKIFESTLQYRSDNLKVSKEKFESLVSNDIRSRMTQAEVFKLTSCIALPPLMRHTAVICMVHAERA